MLLGMTRPQKAPTARLKSAEQSKSAGDVPVSPRRIQGPPRSAPTSRWKSRIVGDADVSPADLIPNLANWRKHPRHQQAALAGALDEIGWIQRVIVNKRTGTIIDGHLRVELALKQKEKSVPVVYVDLSAEEERIALATFDSIGVLAQADEAMFAKLIEEIGADNPALAALLADEEVNAASIVGAALNTGSQLSGMEYRVVVDCRDEEQQTDLLTRFESEGLACRALIS